jgi:hypothetical protein
VFLRATTDPRTVEAAAQGKSFYLRLVIGGDFAPEDVCFECYTAVPKSRLFPLCNDAGGGFMTRTSPGNRQSVEIPAGSVAYLFRRCEDYDLLDIPEYQTKRGYHTPGIEDPFALHLFIYTPDVKRVVHRDSNSPAMKELLKHLRIIWAVKVPGADKSPLLEELRRQGDAMSRSAGATAP